MATGQLPLNAALAASELTHARWRGDLDRRIADVCSLRHDPGMLQLNGLLPAVAICLWISGCSSSARSNWGDQASYHALAVASQYQQQLRAVIARISLPGVSAEQVEITVAKPLEQSVWKVSGVRSIRSQCSTGGLVMEVQFNEPAGVAQLAEVKEIVDAFWLDRSMKGALPTVTLDKASPH